MLSTKDTGTDDLLEDNREGSQVFCWRGMGDIRLLLPKKGGNHEVTGLGTGGFHTVQRDLHRQS